MHAWLVNSFKSQCLGIFLFLSISWYFRWSLSGVSFLFLDRSIMILSALSNMHPTCFSSCVNGYHSCELGGFPWPQLSLCGEMGSGTIFTMNFLLFLLYECKWLCKLLQILRIFFFFRNFFFSPREFYSFSNTYTSIFSSPFKKLTNIK